MAGARLSCLGRTGKAGLPDEAEKHRAPWPLFVHKEEEEEEGIPSQRK